jgi:hypothetical protein
MIVGDLLIVLNDFLFLLEDRTRESFIILVLFYLTTKLSL